MKKELCSRLRIRVLSATKSQPKEMLVIIDKPSLQYIVEELVESYINSDGKK